MIPRYLTILSAALACAVALHFTDAASLGQLKICKAQSLQEWHNDPVFWRRPVTVPAGLVFHDVGTIEDAISEHIKLRIVTLGTGTIKGEADCVVVPAAISQRVDGWGRLAIGPRITAVEPSDHRLLEPELMEDYNAPVPDAIAPWADVMTVNATVLSRLSE
jgi:hypothetical protein